jgi:hypothetical protein
MVADEAAGSARALVTTTNDEMIRCEFVSEG